MIAIRGGRIYRGTQGFHEGWLLLEGSKIRGIETRFDPPSTATVIEAGDRFVLPGFVDASSRIGLREKGSGEMGVDDEEVSSPITPHARALDGVWPEDPAFEDALSCGVTTSFIAPGLGNIVGGSGAVIKSAGPTVDDRTLAAEVGLRISISGTRLMDLIRQVLSGTGEFQRRDRPQNIALLLEQLEKTRAAIRKEEAAENDGTTGTDVRLEPLKKLLQGELFALIQVSKNHDILNALELAEEWGLKLILEGVYEAPFVLDELAASGVPVIVSGLMQNRRLEAEHLSLKTPGILEDRGIPIAFGTDHPMLAVDFFNIQAALTVREGLSEKGALHAITEQAAGLLGVADRVGSLDKGRDADVVVWSELPFRTQARPERVFVDGQEVYCYDGGELE
jgi:imidazolonepropionase-like amidohydrolase